MRTPDAVQLSELVAAEGGQVIREGADTQIVTGMAAQRIAELAAGAGSSWTS